MRWASVLFAGALVTPLCAQQLYAVSYTAPAGEGIAQGAPYELTDQTGRQLIDGSLGTANWLANSAYEWVGWRNGEPAFVFRFAQVVRVSEIRIGVVRNEPRRVFVPPFALVNWEGHSLGQASVAANSRGFVSIFGDWRGDELRLQLIDGNNLRWMLLDEVQFFTVPEPTSWAALAVVAMLVWARRRVSLS